VLGVVVATTAAEKPQVLESVRSGPFMESRHSLQVTCKQAGLLRPHCDQVAGALLGLGIREGLVRPADLVLITAAEIDALVRASRVGGFTIAPDIAGVGTNALCLVTPSPFRVQSCTTLRVSLRPRHSTSGRQAPMPPFWWILGRGASCDDPHRRVPLDAPCPALRPARSPTTLSNPGVGRSPISPLALAQSG
jgi:hypothetical protein